MFPKLKKMLAQKYVHWKIRQPWRELRELPISIPLSAGFIHNVLVVLPRETEMVTAAVKLIEKIKEVYPEWKIKNLDIDKIQQDMLDRFNLPSAAYIDNLRQKKFELALNLNYRHDLRDEYLVTMLKIPYRLHLRSQDGEYYNLFFNSTDEKKMDFMYILNNIQKILIP